MDLLSTAHPRATSPNFSYAAQNRLVMRQFMTADPESVFPRCRTRCHAETGISLVCIGQFILS
jgi:hypothetical protein